MIRRVWRTDVKRYSKVRYAGVYPGIDMVYYGNAQDLEYDFVVAPGTDPSAIAMTVRGGKLRLDASGDLLVRTAGQEVRLRHPVIYQEHDGQRREIAGGYVIENNTRVRFQVGAYDPEIPLVIDPTFVVARYLGGSGTDYLNGLAVDAAGNAHVAGQTNSANFPTTSGALRTTYAGGPNIAFVTKLDPTGNIIYSTFLGGSGGDAAYGIALGSDGGAYVAGQTSSSNFPTVGAFQSSLKGASNGFVAKLSPAGSALVYSTYLGGSVNDYAANIAVGTDGSAYVAGGASSKNFPTLGAFQSALKGQSNSFLAKFTPSGRLAYSSYLGGSGFENNGGIAVDAQGNVYLAGDTTSADFPVTSGAFQKTYAGNTDGWIAKVNASGSALVYATYLGGSARDSVRDMVLDSQGNVWLAGVTASTNFPTLNPIQAANGGGLDAFLSVLDPTGAKLLFSTYYGGNGDDIATGISFLTPPQSSWVQVAIVGTTGSSNLPGPAPSSLGRPVGATNACPDAFIITPSAPGGFTINWHVVANLDKALGCVSTPIEIAVPLPDFPLAADAGGPATVAAGSIWITGNLSGTATAIPGAAPGGPSDGYILSLPLPQVPQGAVVNGTFGAGTSLTPGSITSVFGTNLVTGTSGAAGLPLANTLLGTSVQITAPPGSTTVNVQAPLYFVSPGQINFQMPWELTGQTQALLSVVFNGIPSAPLTINLAPVGPAIFTTNSQGTGQGAIQIANTTTFAAPVGSIPGVDARPATAGDFLTIYCTGLGDVSNRPASGAPAPGGPLASTVATPTVTIGGMPTTATFSGLSPGFVGLYQVNVQVLAGVAPGNAVPVVITIGGASSNTATIAVQ